MQSRANTSFEANDVNTKRDILNEMAQGLQASLCQVDDALGGTVDSMKDAASQVSDVMAEYGDKLSAHDQKFLELSIGRDGSEDESGSGHEKRTLDSAAVSVVESRGPGAGTYRPGWADGSARCGASSERLVQGWGWASSTGLRRDGELEEGSRNRALRSGDDATPPEDPRSLGRRPQRGGPRGCRPPRTS